MTAGYHTGFNPFQGAHGRFATANSSGMHTPPPNAKGTFQSNGVRVLHDAGRAGVTHYAALQHGDQFVSEVRLTRVYHTEIASLVVQAQ